MRAALVPILFAPVKPILDLDYVRSGALIRGETFSRASSGTYFDGAGLLQTAASGVARFDHDPVTGAAKGLLMEEQRTNLLTYSAQFDNAAWTKGVSTVSADATTAPDGTTSADKIIPTATTDYHYVQQAATVVSATTYTASLYAKPAGWNNIGVFFAGAGFSFAGANFNVSTGAIVGTDIGITASIEAVGNGWYRCRITSTSTGTAAAINIYPSTVNSGTNMQATGDGSSGVYLWGAQLEAGAFPTSYIPTAAASATRSADVCSLDLTSVPGWGAALCTAVAEFSVPVAMPNPGRRVFNLYGQAAPSVESINLALFSGTTIRLRVQTGGVTTDIDPASYAAGTVHKVASAMRAGDVAISVNGGSVVTSTPGFPTVLGTLYIGCESGPGNYLGGHIRRIALYNRRLSNAQLQALSR